MQQKKFDFGIRKPENKNNLNNINNINKENLFSITDPEKILPFEIKNIKLEKLRHFNGHPFKLYQGARFNDMVESIKENGIMSPIIVRPISEIVDDETENEFEILSGHNRTEAAKVAGLKYIPAIIREDLTQEEAMFIVIETNLIQRSFADLSHSERALIIATRHEAIKQQGKRNDLINEIEFLLKNPSNLSSNADFETFSQVGNKLKTIEKIGQEYDLSKNSVARYLRINKLSDELKLRLDNGEFGLVPAVDISYLTAEQQVYLNALLEKCNNKYKIDMKKAEQLRDFSECEKLSFETCENILSGLGLANQKKSATKSLTLTLNNKILSEFFAPQTKSEDMLDEIVKALRFYREN